MNFNPTEYIKNWNKKVENWQTDYLSYYHSDILTSFLKKIKSEKYKMKPEYLIEPYIGDINNCSAVFINKNPGSPISSLQHYRDGEFIIQDKAHKDYYCFSKNFPYLDGTIVEVGDWWFKRTEWVSRLAQTKDISISRKPFALEIFPYHSNLLATSHIIMSDDFLKYVLKNIIKPAEFANKHSELGIILSVGNTFEHLYEKLGFRKIVKINQDNHDEHKLDWCKNADNKPINNEYNMWKSKTGAYYLNFVFGANFNKPPAKKWNFVEQYLFNKFIR